MRNSVKGVNKLRRTLKRLEPAQQNHVKKAMATSAKRLTADAVGIAMLKNIKDTGDMIDSIRWKRSSDGFSYLIGPGVMRAKFNKQGQRKFIASKVVNSNPFNTAQFSYINYKTGKRNISDNLYIAETEAQMNFMKGYWHEFGTIHHGKRPFMNEAWDANKAPLIRLVRIAVDRALREAMS